MIVGMLIVNPVPAVLVATRTAGVTVGEVLQVTLSRAPSVATSCTKISELAVTAVVLIVHVAADALVAHENAPAGAAVHDTTEGLAAVRTPAQLVADP